MEEENNTSSDCDFIIDSIFLELIFEQDVESFEVSKGSNPGDNFLSILYAVKVNFAKITHPMHILIKATPQSECLRDYFKEMDYFGREYFIYNEWIPKLRELLDDHDQGIKLSVPEFFGGNHKGKGKTRSHKDIIFPEPWRKEDFIVMSDHRKHDGFRMANRIEGLELDHILIALESLATLHALSWCYKIRNKQHKLTSSFHYFGIKESEFRPMMPGIIDDTLLLLAEGLEGGQKSSVYKGIEKLLRNKSHSPSEIIMKFMTTEGIDERDIEESLRLRGPESEVEGFHTEPWLVMTHGDFWINNLLFKESDADTQPQCLMLDFQASRELCPTTDLAYFLFTSCSATTPILSREMEERILRRYHDTFSSVCENLGCEVLPGFSMESLRRRYRRGKLLGFLYAMSTLTFILKNESTISKTNSNNDMTELNVFSSIMNNKNTNIKLRDRLVQLATGLYEDGVI